MNHKLFCHDQIMEFRVFCDFMFATKVDVVKLVVAGRFVDFVTLLAGPIQKILSGSALWPLLL